MSGFTFASGLKTTTHSSFCPVCRKRREFRVPPLQLFISQLCCSQAHSNAYMNELSSIVERIDPQDPNTAWMVGELPPHVAEILQGVRDAP